MYPGIDFLKYVFVLAVNEVIGRQMGHMFAKVGETARLKWTYRADSLGDILYLHFNKINKINNKRTLIAYQMGSSGSFQLTTNDQYKNRVQVTKNNQDIEIFLKSIRELDGAYFELSMMVMSGITYSNSTEIIVVGKSVFFINLFLFISLCDIAIDPLLLNVEKFILPPMYANGDNFFESTTLLLLPNPLSNV